MTTNSCCPVCGLDSTSGGHTSEKDCLSALKDALGQMAQEITSLKNELAQAKQHESSLRIVLARYQGGEFAALEEEQLKKWLAKLQDPETLTPILGSDNVRLRELAVRYAHPAVWVKQNLEKALYRGHIEGLAKRHLIPDEWMTDEILARYIALPKPRYLAYARKDWRAGIAIGALARAGYKIPEKLRKTTARLVGQEFHPTDHFDQKVAAAVGLLAVPELSIQNLRNIALNFLRVDSERTSYKYINDDTEPVYKAILRHPACTKTLALMLAEKGAENPYVLRALATVPQWRRIPEIKKALARSNEAKILWSLCLDAESRMEFVDYFSKAIRSNLAYVLQCLEKQTPQYLSTDDLMPLLQNKDQRVRLKMISIIGALDRSLLQNTKPDIQASADRVANSSTREAAAQMRS